MAKRIVLDTSVVRNLFYEEQKWIRFFIEMKKDGWTFHLSDIAVAELIAQFERNPPSITVEQWSDGISKLEKFVSDWLPCLPSKRQLFHLCGFEDLKDPNKNKDTEVFRTAYSKAIWQTLQQLALHPEQKKGVFFEADGKRYECPFRSLQAEEELKTEREKWIQEMSRMPKENFDYIGEVEKIKVNFDSWASTSGIPMSIRGDILAHAQAEWERRLASGYSAYSEKRRNDGIDFLLNFAFMWPSLIITADKKLHNFLQNLKSYQSKWVYTPEELVEAWENNSLINPSWPEQKSD